MNKNELTEYADYLLKTAMYKVNNIEEAQELVQETLMAALIAIHQNKPVENPKSWLVTVLNRKYYDMLRKKYRKGTVSIDMIGEIPLPDEITEQIERSEDAENIRRCLANLTGLYRQVMVRYYMHGESVKQIATALGIPENTVKSRLDTGRKHIRKDFTMEKYTKQSYEPETLWVSICGREGLDNEPFSLVGDRKIEMNLLILAYDKPITIPELAGAIGISTTYIEPIVEKLVRGELMKRVGDKVYTDFIIFDEKDRTINLPLEKELAEKYYKDVWNIMERGFDELHNQEYYKKQTPSAARKLDSFFAVRTVLHGINSLTENKVGEWSFEDFTDRPNGGKWHAMGSRYPADYNWSETYWYKKYYIDGEYSVGIDNYEGVREVTF
ncbi:MAG: RNA polymerase sigma factor, partial [Ruminiclostridium sp.]|nr:RNA polymerase sigma factor [Ruminiclostridium sp.]